MIPAICVLIVILLVGGFYWGYRMEKRDWNNGVCPCEKGWWNHFDTDSQGGDGYSCTDCNRTIWITFPGIVKRG